MKQLIYWVFSIFLLLVLACQQIWEQSRVTHSLPGSFKYRVLLLTCLPHPGYVYMHLVLALGHFFPLVPARIYVAVSSIAATCF